LKIYVVKRRQPVVGIPEPSVVKLPVK